MDTSAAIAKLGEAVAADPQSPSLRALAESLTKRQQSLESEFLSIAAEQGLDVCSYRLLEEIHRPTITDLTIMLGDFQSLFSITYDAIKYGPKRTKRLGPESARETALTFAYAYPGSTGFVFTLPRDIVLFGETRLDKTVKVIGEMAVASTSENVLEFSRRLGPSPVRAMHKWATGHAQSGFAADIQWRQEKETRARIFVQKPEFVKLQSVIGATSEESEDIVQLVGELVGADVTRRSFHIRLHDGQDIRGSFTDAISPKHTVELPKRYKAVVLKRTRILFSTEEEEINYHLERLDTAD
jgi:hypothetical protein